MRGDWPTGEALGLVSRAAPVRKHCPLLVGVIPGKWPCSPPAVTLPPPTPSGHSVRVECLLGAALHVQPLVAEQVVVVQEALDAVATLQGPAWVLGVDPAVAL